MISRQSLDLAVAQGIVTREQAERLAALAAAGEGALEEDRQDDEKLRFIGGFSDIFVTLGVALFLGASAWFAQSRLGIGGMWAITAALAWLLAEFFTRRRRMALPSIALLLCFAGAAFAALAFAFADALPEGRPVWREHIGFLPETKGFAEALGAFVAIGLAALHYWRFKVPITIAACAGLATTAIVAFVLALAPDLNMRILSAIVIGCGLVVFLEGMRFDMADPARVTRSADIAFWLHLLAAPLIVQPLMFGFLGGVENLDAPRAAGILAIFLVLGLVAIVIDRRAFLVSALAYAGFAFGALIERSGIERDAVPATLLALGVFVLAISALWRPLRHAALRLLPKALTQHLPHPLRSMPS